MKNKGKFRQHNEHNSKVFESSFEWVGPKICKSPLAPNGFLLQKNYFQLWNNTDIYLTRPDKGAGIVVLNHSN